MYLGNSNIYACGERECRIRFKVCYVYDSTGQMMSRTEIDIIEHILHYGTLNKSIYFPCSLFVANDGPA